MKIAQDKRLFWFLKEGVQLDLGEPSVLEMYIQQVLSYGRFDDIKDMFKNVQFEQFKETLLRIKHFLQPEVRMFWEDFIGANKQGSETNIE